MGPNEQNQHFAELRQKICLYIRGLPSLDGINELFVGKKEEELLAKSSQTGYNRSLCVNFVNCVKQKNILCMSCCWDASCNEFLGPKIKSF